VVNWKRNLFMVWLSQFLSILGFCVAMPFFPFYIQELGVTNPVRLKLWVALINASGPLTMALCAPLWGVVADRYGRRLMMLRATFGGAVCLALMGTVPNVQWLFILRLIQGTLTGTVTAAQTLVSVHTPNNRSGLALGILSTAVFTGGMAGNLVGGCLAEQCGYRTVFYVAGVVLALSTLLIFFGVEEEFVRRKTRDPWRSFRVGAARVMSAWSILVLIGFMAFCRQFDFAMFPLYVQEVKGAIKGAALWTGSLHAIGGVAALLAGIILGWLADWIAPARIGRWSAFGAALMMVPLGMATGFLTMALPRFALVFCAGGLDPVFQIWLAKVTPDKSRGILFGWALTCKCIGWTMAALVSATVASAFNLRSVYFVGAAFYLILIPMISLVVWRMGLRNSAKE
jgi:DHA1 family multidrug resistance protein-like MFS transporter